MRRLLSLLGALAATALLITGATPAAAEIGVAPNRGFVPREVVYKLQGQHLGRALSLPVGADVREAARALRSNPRVVYAEPNYIATASAAVPVPAPLALPNDPGTIVAGTGAEAASEAGSWASKQWNFLPWQEPPTPGLPVSPGGIDAVGAWQNLARLGRPGAAGVTVAVLDTGIAYRKRSDEFAPSPDFSPEQFTGEFDLVDRDLVPLDENGHGTHVAGTIAEQTDNGIGLTGLAYRAKLMPVRVLDSQGRGDAVEIANGIRVAVSHGADVINMSFNFACGKRVPVVDEALRRAYQAGIVAVASAGNIGSEGCVSEPATGPRVIAVGGTTEGGCLGNYSLAGSIDVVAPGGGEPIAGCPSVLSRPIFQVTLQPGSTTAFSIPSDYLGTSMAAAHVSGVAAMVVAIGYHRKGPNRLAPTRIVNAVTGRLRKTARDLGLPRTQQGAGLIDANRATRRRPFLN
ncbi:MAG: S8 family serine peptidase [Solirubrobacterales bacterium]